MTGLIGIAVSSVEMEEVLKELAEFVRRLVSYEWMRVCVRPQNEEELKQSFAVCDGRPVSTSGTALSLHDSLQGEAILGGRPIERKDLLKEATYPDERFLAAEFGLRFLLVLPLSSRGRTIGTLELGRKAPAGCFTEAETEMAREIATHGGSVVEHAWLVEESKGVCRIQERRRLAWEIHDTVIQSLISIVLQLELAEQRLRSDVPAAYSEIRQASELAHACLEDARRLVLNLRPPLLEQKSLTDAVAREVAGLEAAGVVARFSAEGEPLPLSSETETALYRIAQEAVANIRKHATATQVTATLKYGPDSVWVSIADNGVGFDPSVPSSRDGKGHFGLTSAHQRAERAGGTFSVESAPGQGTKVTAELPVAGARVAERPANGNGRRSFQGVSIRVLLVDDHAVVRQGLRGVLDREPGIEVVGEATNAAEALDMAKSLRPDVAIVDVQLPGMGGIEFVGALASQSPKTRALILSAHRGCDLVQQAIRAGAQGYLLKETAGSSLVDAVRGVHGGGMHFDPAAGADLATRDVNEDAGREHLTVREDEVLHSIARGLRNKEIARELGLSEATVKYHVAHLFEKLGVGGRTEALLRAQKLGLIRPEFAN
jgi:signal transduction histidine kinase/DNA-binding NarL/FixJ family response regulator